MTAIADTVDRSTVEQLIQTVEGLQETVKQQAERIDQLETELAEHKDHTGRELAKDRSRLNEIEESQEQHAPELEPEPEPEPQTPIERMARGKDTVAMKELTGSAKRALIIYEHIDEWSQPSPGGRCVKWAPKRRPTLRTRLREATGNGKLNWKQVERACEALEELSEQRINFIRGSNGNVLALPNEPLSVTSVAQT